MGTIETEVQKINLNSVSGAFDYLKMNLMEELGFDEEDLDELEDDENLFTLGLDSISMTGLIDRWEKELEIEVQSNDFLREPTLESWAEFIYNKVNETSDSSSSAKQELIKLFNNDEENRYELFKLNGIQNAYVVGRNTEIPWGGISCYGYFEMDAKDLDLSVLQRALNDLIKRHEMLRVRVYNDGTQKILPEMSFDIPVYKLEKEEDLDQHLAELRERMSTQIIPLERPLFDLRVSEMKNNAWRIHFGMDFIASDALSLRLFWRDLTILYTQHESGNSSDALPEIKASFKDYLNYLELKEKSHFYETDKKYWLDRIDTLPAPPKLPVKNQVSEFGHKANDFAHFEKTFNKAQWDKFSQFAAQKKLTPTAALISIFSEVLSAWGSGQNFGLMLTVFDRDPVHPDIDKVIGDFTHLSLLNVNCLSESIEENAQQVQWQMQEDLQHKSYSAIEVVKEINKANPNANVFYPVVFTSALGLNKDNSDFGEQNVFGKIGYSSSQTPQVWLDAQVMTKNGETLIAWDVLNTIFPEGLISAMFDTYINLIDRATQDITFWETKLQDLRPEYQQNEHNAVNASEYAYPDYLLHEQIINYAKQNPNKEAIVFQDKRYTYDELLHKANHIANLLAHNKIEKGARVVVQMEKSFESIAVILGIVQYGAAYVPMSHNNPKSRTVDIIEQAGAQAFIADVDFEVNDVATGNITHIKHADITWDKTNFTPSSIAIDDVAYVIFTSGSTGKPKGVVITHEAAVNTILDVNRRFNVTENDTAFGVSAYSFDLSVYDIFGVLALGGKLVVPTEEQRIDPMAWKSLIAQHNITLWNSVPALFNILLDSLANDTNSISINKVFLSGDWIPLSTHDRMKNVMPAANLVSMGGATEASIWSNYYEVKEIKSDWSSVPYGYPLANQQFYILDDFGRPCPTFVKGKLHIAGKGLAQKYWGSESLTKKAFYHHPVLNIRLYDTGDYGRYIEDGVIEFLGRQDDQLKINGYRIEIGEIQMAFQKCNPELDPVILPIGEKSSNKKLVAFVKTDVSSFSEADLKGELANHLPPYFIPDTITALDSYPITNNGKVDRKELTKLAKDQQSVGAANAKTKQKFSQGGSGMVHPVLALVREVFELPELTEQDQFSELGVSSMDIIRLANQLETNFLDRPTVGDMVRFGSVEELIEYYQDKDITFDNYENSAANAVSGNERVIEPQFLLFSEDQMTYMNSLKFIENFEDRQAYKKSRVARRQDLKTNTEISLGTPNNPDIYSNWRKSYRQFLDKTVSFDEFTGYLNLCAAQAMDQNYRFNYASSGGIYPVQIYLTVFKDKVENVNEGYYYFDQYNQKLILISNENVVPPTQLNFNHDWLDQGAFAVHMIADMEAVYPIYEKESLRFGMIESGFITQLLESEGVHYNVGSCQLGGYDFDRVKSNFDLSDRHYYLHTLIAGAIDFKTEKAVMQEERKALNWQNHTDALNALIDACTANEVNLWVEDDKLKFKAPKGALDKALLEQLKKHKESLIQYLQSNTYKSFKVRFDKFALTPIQNAFLMGRDDNFELGNVGSHYYSELEWPNLDISKLEEVINHIIGLHDALRTVIYEDGTQAVLPTTPYFNVKVSDEKSEDIRVKRSHHKYPIGEWPMFNFEVSHANTAHTKLHLSVDLLILDAWSADLLMREVIKAYQGEIPRQPGYTVKEYIRDEKKWHLEHESFIQKANEYWASKIDNMPKGPQLPFKVPLAEVEQPRFKRYKFAVSDEAIHTLTERSKDYQVSATAVFATIFSKLLSQWSGGKALTLNMTLFNRLGLHPDVNEVMGDFTNVALISYFPDDRVTFLSEVMSIQDQIWQAVEHRAKNGLEILRELNKNNPGKAIMPVVFTSLLSSESAEMENNFFPEGVKEVYAVSQTPQVVIDHQIYRRGDEYLINWDVVEDAFNLDELDGIIARYEQWVHDIVNAETWSIQLDNSINS
ncbi:MAG: amino acid adenylation domain-containing protein [Flavobacteriaceae bacterium]|nr:amino acid adenylation domain-containing protein [Flavobacteriaceae bacterium]